MNPFLCDLSGDNGSNFEVHNSDVEPHIRIDGVCCEFISHVHAHMKEHVNTVIQPHDTAGTTPIRMCCRQTINNTLNTAGNDDEPTRFYCHGVLCDEFWLMWYWSQLGNEEKFLGETEWTYCFAFGNIMKQHLDEIW